MWLSPFNHKLILSEIQPAAKSQVPEVKPALFQLSLTNLLTICILCFFCLFF